MGVLKAILSLGYEVFEQVLGSQLDPDQPIGNGGFWVTEIELRLLWPRTLGEAKPPISGTIYWGAHTNTHIYTITHTQTDTWTHKHTKQQKSRYTLSHRQTHRILLEAHNLTKNCLKNVYMVIFGKKWNTRPAMCKVFFCFFFLCEKRCLPIWRNEIEANMKYEPGGHTCPVVEEFTHLWFKVHARSVRVMAPSLQCTPSNSPGTVGYTCYLALLAVRNIWCPHLFFGVFFLYYEPVCAGNALIKLGNIKDT